jgi:mannose-1-phosphate guanylyltransferase / mannose-6-phosphate isomerase
VVFGSSRRVEEIDMRVLILAGGGGTRLWPLSTEENPKQFIKLPGMTISLFQVTLKRALLFCQLGDLLVVTSKRYVEHVFNQSKEVGITLTSNQVFLESKRLNTLPAILAGLLFAKVSQNENVLVLPSDHILLAEQALVDAVHSASTSIASNIVVFGIKPTFPHTGYGYIKPSELILKGLFHVDTFKEKPDVDTAITYVSKGYLWNAGIFYFNAGFLMDVLRQYQPKLIEHFATYHDVYQAFDAWNESLSIDYGLMELISTIVVAEVHTSWTDIGSFDAFIELINPTNQSMQQIAGQGSVVISDHSTRVVTIGVDDLIIVSTPSGLLICKKGQSELVKNIK